MAFLTPLFLIALAGLAIPVFLHLIQRERKQLVQFPSLMFLRRIPYQSVQRRRIRHWLLLMMRLAALALIVLAFGRPFFRGADPAAAGAGGAREVVVLVDRSYSMGYGNRWDRALAAARGAVDGLTGADRASIVFFGSGTDVALRSTSDKGRLHSALAGAKLSSGATHYGPVLKLAGSILSESRLPRREVVLVTDFQRGGWRGADGVRLPDGTVLTPIAIGDAETTNLAVTAVALERSTFSDQERVTVTAGVVNRAGRRVDGLDISLDINGRTIQTQRVAVEPNASASTTFAPVTLTGSEVRATVKLAPDAMERDNAFHFMVEAGRPVRTMLVDGDAREGGLYLQRALAVGDAPRFETISRSADALSTDDLQSAGVVILNDVQVSSSFAERLGKFVERGGGLLVIVGRRGTWPQERSLIVPALPGEAVDRSRGQAARLVGLEYGHPVFEPFRAPRSGDFSAARFYGYRAVTAQQSANVLARFEDGAPALIERRVGTGRVLVWASSLGIEWSDLPVKPVFLPFVHQMARHLAGYREPEPWLTVGDVLDPARTTGAAQATDVRTVVSPSGQRIALDPEGGDVVALEEQGFYELREQATTGDPAATVAVNVDLSESDLTPMDPEEVVAAVTGRGASAVAGEGAAEMTDATREATQRMWWYLLFAGAILLAAETLVSNRIAM
jgi:hypothetical protein